MCNDYRLEVDIASIAEDFDGLEINIDMPEGAPNVPAREDVRITDTAPIVKSSDGAAAGSLVNRRWSWPGQGGKPVYNVRSERRDLGMQRCLVLCDGFYEFTDPTDPAQKRLDKWLFTMKDHRWFCMAGVAWLDPRVPADEILKWLPEGSLEVSQVYGKPPAQGALAL